MGLGALAPIAAKGARKLAAGAGKKAAEPIKNAGEKAGEKVGDTVKGAAGKSKNEMPGVGKGRRMPVQQDIDIGAPLKTVYNQWTQFEDWPKFMHRVQQISQEDETHLTFKTKIWGISKEFKAEIVEQRPDERIKWRVTEGVSHTGVVTFHELGPRLTRVELNLDVEPGSLLEKAARGMRHVKRAVRADLARFKAYVLMEEEETGAWRGTVEDGDVKRQTSRRQSSGGRSRRSTSSRSRASSRSRSRTSSNGRGASRSRSSSAKRTRASSSNSGSGSRSRSSRSKSGSRS